MPDQLPRRVLAVGAHPDDIEILAGGTMALYAQAGCEVVLCTATNGDRGSVDLEPEEVGRIREGEAARAAAVIGARYIPLGISDCHIVYGDLEMRTRFLDLIREVDPDIVFTHDPADYHSDHIGTSRHVFDATFMASVSLLKSERPATGKIPPLLHMDTLVGINFEPEQYVDISTVLETKREMLACHVSQVEWMKKLDSVDLADQMDVQTRFRGIQCGAKYAEAFRPAREWLRGTTRRLLP